MGVVIHLDVRWDAIDRTAWAEVYDETLTLLRSHPSQLLGVASRALLGHRVPMYTSAIERIDTEDRRWCVAGDRRSMRFAESFEMPRIPPRPLQSERRRAGDTDLALQDLYERGAGRLFNGMTHAAPYHLPIVAAGLVIEARFPGAALLYGDVDEAEVRWAKQWAHEVLGRDLPMPVLWNAPVLIRRLSRRWRGEALLEAFVRRFRGDLGFGLAAAFADVEPLTREEYLRRRLCRPHASDDTAPTQADVIRGWLLATGDVKRLCAAAGAALPPHAIVSMLAQIGVLLRPELRRRAEQCRLAPLPAHPEATSLTSLVGAVFIDRAWSGPTLDERTLGRALAHAYPAEASALLARLREETARFESSLTRLCDQIEQSARLKAGLDAQQDVGELVSLRSADDLLPSSRRRLAAFAYALRRARPTSSQELVDSPRTPDALRSLLVQSASRRDPTLTEHAWTWILEESDPTVLALLVDAHRCRAQTHESADLQRAVLESRVLCMEVARMMGDKAAMAEGRALFQEAIRMQRVLPLARS